MLTHSRRGQVQSPLIEIALLDCNYVFIIHLSTNKNMSYFTLSVQFRFALPHIYLRLARKRFQLSCHLESGFALLYVEVVGHDFVGEHIPTGWQEELQVDGLSVECERLQHKLSGVEGGHAHVEPRSRAFHSKAL